MLVNYTTEAFASLSGLINFIEANNTTNAGLRWLNRFETFLNTTLLNPDKIRFCNNATFNKLDLRCIYFNDWLIAFSVHQHFVLIEAIMHTSRISD